MRMTLLEMVQSILSDISGDEVGSIDDTFESSQVAEIIRSTYVDMMSNRNWPHLKKLIKFTASGNIALPTHMTIPDTTKELVSVRYDNASAGATRKDYQVVVYKEPEDFLRYIYSRDSSHTNIVTVIDPSGSELFIYNDRPPVVFTSFDDVTACFDAYDLAVDDTLQESRIQVTAYMTPEWVHTDDASPDLPIEAFSALLSKAKAICFTRVAQRADGASANEAKVQQSWLARKARKAGGGIQYNKYGRGRVHLVVDKTFRK